MLALALCAAVRPGHAQNAAIESGGAKILYFEPFIPAPAGVRSVQEKAGARNVWDLHFSAYGRRFELLLEKNSRLAAPSDASLDGPALSLYRGVIQNIPGSWVRMSARGQLIRGMIWDGRDLYIVELAEAVRAASDALPPAAAMMVIFKLADTLVEDGAAVCATVEQGATRRGSDVYDSLLKELKGASVLQDLGATVRLELSALGDAQFSARYPSEQQARDEILLRLNNVDGIFSSQLGVEIQVPTLAIPGAANDPFSDTTVPATLLRELGVLRSQTPEFRQRGLTHLFTGRDLDGNTVGIAYQNSLCRSADGAGLTEASGRTAWVESLIAAHEIGHNFGASHDGEADCAATPQGQFLMSPSVNPNAGTFSQCSLDAMFPRIQGASCIAALSPADISIPADLGTIERAVFKPFALDLTVTNKGGATVVDARAEVQVPPVIQVDGAYVAGGTCTSGAGVVACRIGDVPGSASRIIRLTLRSDVVGSNSLAVRLSAQNDAQPANNTGDGTLVIGVEADLAVALQSPATMDSGSSATLQFSAENLSDVDAAAVEVEFTLSSGLAAASAAFGGGDCSVQAQTFRCVLPSLAAGAMSAGTVVINAVAPGSATVQARVLSDNVDTDTTNDVAVSQITVSASTVSSMQGGNRGGGSSGSLLLLGLAALAGMRAAKRKRSRFG